MIFDLVIIKETISGFCDIPGITGLGDGERRMIGEDVSDEGESFGETLVAKFGLAKF